MTTLENGVRGLRSAEDATLDETQALLRAADLLLKRGDLVPALEAYERAAMMHLRGGRHLQALLIGRHLVRTVDLRAPELVGRVGDFGAWMADAFLAVGLIDEAMTSCHEGARAMELAGRREDAARLRRRALVLRPPANDR